MTDEADADTERLRIARREALNAAGLGLVGLAAASQTGRAHKTTVDDDGYIGYGQGGYGDNWYGGGDL